MLYTLLLAVNAFWFFSSLYEIWFDNGDMSDFICLVFAAISIIWLGSLQELDERRSNNEDEDD